MAEDDSASQTVRLRLWEGPVWDRIRAALRKYTARQEATATDYGVSHRCFSSSRRNDPGPGILGLRGPRTPRPPRPPKTITFPEDTHIIEWLKEEGEFVKKWNVVVEVETGKAILSLEAPCEGYVHQKVRKGYAVAKGQPIATITSQPVTLQLAGTEPGGDFCEGCNGRGCWCQTWEPVATKPRRCVKTDEPFQCSGRALPGSNYCQLHQIRRSGRTGTPGKRNQGSSSRTGSS